MPKSKGLLLRIKHALGVDRADIDPSCSVTDLKEKIVRLLQSKVSMFLHTRNDGSHRAGKPINMALPAAVSLMFCRIVYTIIMPPFNHFASPPQSYECPAASDPSFRLGESADSPLLNEGADDSATKIETLVAEKVLKRGSFVFVDGVTAAAPAAAPAAKPGASGSTATPPRGTRGRGSGSGSGSGEGTAAEKAAAVAELIRRLSENALDTAGAASFPTDVPGPEKPPPPAALRPSNLQEVTRDLERRKAVSIDVIGKNFPLVGGKRYKTIEMHEDATVGHLMVAIARCGALGLGEAAIDKLKSEWEQQQKEKQDAKGEDSGVKRESSGVEEAAGAADAPSKGEDEDAGSAKLGQAVEGSGADGSGPQVVRAASGEGEGKDGEEEEGQGAAHGGEEGAGESAPAASGAGAGGDDGGEDASHDGGGASDAAQSAGSTAAPAGAADAGTGKRDDSEPHPDDLPFVAGIPLSKQHMERGWWAYVEGKNQKPPDDEIAMQLRFGSLMSPGNRGKRIMDMGVERRGTVVVKDLRGDRRIRGFGR